LERDLDEYIQFKRTCDSVELSPEKVDFEDFMGYLDLEHFLGLRGSDTWSRDGNKTQVLIKSLIARIIVERTPPVDELPDVYYRFAEELDVTDAVLTFNYDLLLERALEKVGKPYRLFPIRYKDAHGTVDEREEVVVLKLHGSVDWFDRTDYTDLERSYRDQGFSDPPRDPIFMPGSIAKTVPVMQGQEPGEDPLAPMFRVLNIEALYASHQTILVGPTPWLLSPSTTKFVYSDKLREFWWGLGQAGAWILGVTFIGYSFPPHDNYVRQAMFKLLRNYQEKWWNEDFPGNRHKGKVVLIDRKENPQDIEAFQRRYGFVDREKSVRHFGGFNEEAIRIIHAAR